MHEMMCLHKHKQRETPEDMKLGLPLLDMHGDLHNRMGDILNCLEIAGKQG